MRAAGLFAVLVAAATPGLASAATSSATMSVSATVVARCSADARAAAQNRPGCDKDVPYSVVVHKLPTEDRREGPPSRSEAPRVDVFGSQSADHGVQASGLVEYTY